MQPRHNRTILSEFFLSGLSDLPSLQLPLFLFFLLIYLLTLTWNLLIISLIVADSHLHTPMYFFLGNLASLDLCFSSVTVPRMLFDLLTKRRMIAVTACVTQVFFFLLFGMCEVFLLAVMSYDRYVAICRPLHYMQIMCRKVCVQLISSIWSLSFMNSIVHTLWALKMQFCGSSIIESFFCDLPQLFHISCSSIYVNILLLLIFSCVFGFGPLIMTFLPYITIYKTVLKIQSKGGRSKVFSTCTPHLMVVFLFYGSSVVNYFLQSVSDHFAGDRVLSVIYSVIIPLVNPVIYSLRNQVLKKALRDVLTKLASKANSGNPCISLSSVSFTESEARIVSFRTQEDGSALIIKE